MKKYLLSLVMLGVFQNLSFADQSALKQFSCKIYDYEYGLDNSVNCPGCKPRTQQVLVTSEINESGVITNRGSIVTSLSNREVALEVSKETVILGIYRTDLVEIYEIVADPSSAKLGGTYRFVDLANEPKESRIREIIFNCKAVK